MFTNVEADIPLFLPGKTGAIHAQLIIDVENNGVNIDFEDPEFAQHLLSLMRVNNLLGVTIGTKYVAAEPKVPGL